MIVDFRRSKTLGIFLASFCAGFATFVLVENLVPLLPGTAPVGAAKADRQANPQAMDPAALSEKPGLPSGSPSSDRGTFRPEVGKSRDPQARGEAGTAAATPAPQSQTPIAQINPSGMQPKPPLASISPSLAGPANPANGDGQSSPAPSPSPGARLATNDANQPSYEIEWADASNYGERFTQDIFNQPAVQQPIIVLHETVSSADSAIAYFQTPHPNDDDQASYHTLIRRNGVVVYLVPPEKRAYGAGNSVFVGPSGVEETIKTHKQFSPSVNNFSYHISLESPTDGYGEEASHSGYSQAQYDSLAWLIGQSTVPWERITTHQQVDRSGERVDPRSFDFGRLKLALGRYRRW